MKSCKNCGKEIPYLSKQRKFCSEKCCDDHHTGLIRQKKGIKHRVIYCPVCSKEISTWSTIKVYCSMDCSRAAQSSKAWRKRHGVS